MTFYVHNPNSGWFRITQDSYEWHLRHPTSGWRYLVCENGVRIGAFDLSQL